MYWFCSYKVFTERWTQEVSKIRRLPVLITIVIHIIKLTYIHILIQSPCLQVELGTGLGKPTWRLISNNSIVLRPKFLRPSLSWSLDWFLIDMFFFFKSYPSPISIFTIFFSLHLHSLKLRKPVISHLLLSYSFS